MADTEIKLSRAEQSARHRYDKALTKALRAAAKGTSWRTIQGVLFKEHGGWLYSIWPAVYIYERETHVSLQVKPMAIDPIFWDITDIPNHDQPLSFRILGAFTCDVPERISATVEESEDCSEVAQRILTWADRNFDLAVTSLSMPTFVEALRSNQQHLERGSYSAAVVCSLISAGLEEDALLLCDQAIEKKWQGGFMFCDGQSFFDLAKRWLLDRQREASTH